MCLRPHIASDGLFRQCAPNRTVQLLKARAEQDRLHEIPETDVHALASLLKSWLREVPQGEFWWKFLTIYQSWFFKILNTQRLIRFQAWFLNHSKTICSRRIMKKSCQKLFPSLKVFIETLYIFFSSSSRKGFIYWMKIFFAKSYSSLWFSV